MEDLLSEPIDVIDAVGNVLRKDIGVTNLKWVRGAEELRR